MNLHSIHETSLEVLTVMGNPKDKFGNKRKTRSSTPSNHALVSGERAKHSGVYSVEHESHEIHKVETEIFIRRGANLPVCRQCARPLKFQLKEKINYIAEDTDFQ
jgi:hypothetical protein